MAVVQGLDGGETNSQQSQTSLFACGSQPASSLELFSEPANSFSSSSHSQHSQSDLLHHSSTRSDMQSQSQDEGRGIQNIQMDGMNNRHRQQTQGQNKYYMRYLSTMSRPNSTTKRGQQDWGQQGEGSTPLATGTRQADSSHSNAAFENWKLKQQDRLDKKKLIEEVLSTSGYTKELKTTLDNLRDDIKEALSSQTTNEKAVRADEVQESGLNHELLHQLVQGQTEMKEELRSLGTPWNQALLAQKNEISELKLFVSSLRDQFTTTLQTSLSSTITRLLDTLNPSLQKLEIQISAFSELLESQCQPIHHDLVQDMRKDDGGLEKECLQRRTDDTHPQFTPSTDACVPTLHGAEVTHQNDVGRTSEPSSQSKSSQIVRKRKGVRDYRPDPTVTHVSNYPPLVGGDPQYSGGDTSTPCDIDLTQHSPLNCSQIITDKIQRMANSSQQHLSIQPQSSSQQRNNILQTSRPETIFSPSPLPPRGPVTKKKKCGGKTRRQKQPRPKMKRKVLSTPKVTRRSERLNKPSDHQPLVRPRITDLVEYGEEDGEMAREEDGGLSTRDVLDDWLDFKPPQDPQSEVKTISRFQRSSEAARRRLMVTEQMSSTMAATRDTVLRELLSSTPSILSP